MPSKESNKKYGKRCWPTLPATTRGTRFVQATAKEAGTTEPEPPLHCRQCAPTPPQPRRRTCFTSGTSPSSSRPAHKPHSSWRSWCPPASTAALNSTSPWPSECPWQQCFWAIRTADAASWAKASSATSEATQLLFRQRWAEVQAGASSQGAPGTAPRAHRVWSPRWHRRAYAALPAGAPPYQHPLQRLRASAQAKHPLSSQAEEAQVGGRLRSLCL